MVLQLALGAMLTVGAGLMIRSAIAIDNVPLGFNPDNVMAASIVLGGRETYPPASRIAFFESLQQRIGALPGVRATTYANQLPLRGSWSSGMLVEPIGPEPLVQTSAGFQSVSAEFFDVFGIPLKQGRSIAETDRTGQPAVAVVNEAFGRVLLGGGSAIGRVIRRGPNMPAITIVGVVGDVRRGGRLVAVEPEVYLPATQPELYPLQVTQFAVRTDGDESALAAAIREAVWAIDPRLPVTNVRSLDETLSLQLAERRFQTWLFSLFSAIALALVGVGIYGVVSYAVGQRTPEIGLRLAMGAGRWQVLALMLRQSVVLATLGSALGLAAAYGLSRYMTALVWQVSATDPMSYLQAGAITMSATLAASLLAAQRAARVAPGEALKSS
jgi:predicted permease